MKRKHVSILDRAFLMAFQEARKGIRKGHGGPFGAAVILPGRIIVAAHNTVLRDNDPTAHAEVNAIRAAAKKIGRPHLENCILVTTSEPCDMCYDAAVLWARIRRIRYAVPCADAEKAGFREHVKTPGSDPVEFICVGRYEEEGRRIFSEWKQRGGALY